MVFRLTHLNMRHSRLLQLIPMCNQPLLPWQQDSLRLRFLDLHHLLPLVRRHGELKALVPSQEGSSDLPQNLTHLQVGRKMRLLQFLFFADFHRCLGYCFAQWLA